MSYRASFIQPAGVAQYSFNAAGLQADCPIAMVDAPRTALILNGCASGDVGGFPCGNGLYYIQLLNSTTVRATSLVAGGAAVINFTVVQFHPAFLLQPVQYGTCFPGVIQSITPVSAKGFVLPLGIAESVSSAQADMASVTGSVSLSGAAAIIGYRQGSGGIHAPDNCRIGYCIVDPR